MKTIIAGSRSVNDIKIVLTAAENAEAIGITVTEVVSGCARGVDQLGEQIALMNGIPIKKFPADWERFGKRAGFLRNVQMADYAEALIAVWDGESKGTKHMIDMAKARGLKVCIFYVPKTWNALNTLNALQ